MNVTTSPAPKSSILLEVEVPADRVGRYVDTRVAVFPGSRLLIRGHDHHAVHHLFPRVPHYDLPALWREIACRHPELARRVIFVTGDTLSAGARDFLRETGCACVEKPFTQAELLGKVRAGLQG